MMNHIPVPLNNDLEAASTQSITADVSVVSEAYVKSTIIQIVRLLVACVPKKSTHTGGSEAIAQNCDQIAVEAKIALTDR